MARKRTSRARAAKPARRWWPKVRAALQATWRWMVQREVWGFGLTVLGLITIISLASSDQGALGRAWSLMLRQMFGLGAYVVAVLLTASGIVLLAWPALESRLHPRWQTIVGWELAFFAALGLSHVLSPEHPLNLARAGGGGGYIGWALWQAVVPLLGRLFGGALLGAALLGGLYLATGHHWHGALWGLRVAAARVGVGLRRRLATEPEAPAPEAVRSTFPPPRAEPAPREASAPATRSASAAPAPRRERSPRERKRPAHLPSLDLLVADEAGNGDDADARLKAQIIEETLEAFGIPARVTEWHRGPVVTQFGVEPGYIERPDRDGNTRRYKVRVSKILALNNDLALALAATPIRIEAPVPGRGVVGIEVPNDVKSVVGLRGVIESAAFRRLRGPLRIALGRDVSGEPFVADLAAMPHLLLAGATGTGKSACLNAIIAALLFHNGPDQLRLLLIDPKRVELVKYNGIPHLLAPVVVDLEKVIVSLRWITREMDRRYGLLAEHGARNIEGYNRIAAAKGLDPLPMVVVIIDELADLMLAAPDDVERTICRLAQMARATGIHLVLATQRPSVDVVTGLIKANFPARISFAVTSQVDSRVVLDTPGAEKLLGRGDMLYMAPDSPRLQRIQGCWVSDRELDELVAYWRREGMAHITQQDEPAPWEEMMAEEDDDADALLDQAADLVRRHQQASASFLQRQMRIGYPRAARLIDQLEERGIVGPAEPGGRSRAVITETDPSEPSPADAAGDDAAQPSGSRPSADARPAEPWQEEQH